ncbi:MAG: hypothetical protein Fur0011_7090 [Candidatus Microgenomates bacterium]
MPEETMSAVNMRDVGDFTNRITTPDVPDVVTNDILPNAISGLEGRARANATRRKYLDTWTEGVEAAAKSRDVRSNRTEQLKKDKKVTKEQLEVKEFELDRLEDQEADLHQDEVLATQKKAGVESQISAVNKQIESVQSELNSLNALRRQAIAKARSDSATYVEERKSFYQSDRALELGSLEDKSGIGSSLEDLDKVIEKIQGLLVDDVKEVMSDIGPKGKKAKSLIESGIQDLVKERTKLSEKLRELEARRSEVKKLYYARVEDVEVAEKQRLGKREESINRKYDKREEKLKGKMASLEAKKRKLESKQNELINQIEDIANKRQNNAELRKILSSQSSELQARLEALTNRLEAKKTQADRLLSALDSRMEKAVSEQGDIAQELDLQVSVLSIAEAGLEETRTSLCNEVRKEFEQKFEILKHRQEEGVSAARTERDSQIREAMGTVGELQVSVDADNRIVVKPEFDVDTNEMDQTMREAVVLASASASFTKLATVAPQMREALGAYQASVTEISKTFNEGARRINQQMDQLYKAIDNKVDEAKVEITALRERAEQAQQLVQQLVVEMEEAGEDKDEGTWKRITSAIGRWVGRLRFGKR